MQIARISCAQVLALMENKEAVSALVSFIIPKEGTPDDAYHVMLGMLLKLSSISTWANEVRAYLHPELRILDNRKA